MTKKIYLKLRCFLIAFEKKLMKLLNYRILEF